MSQRAAIVTGASRGIGLALAEALAEEGYALTLTARRPETLERTADTLRERGGDVEHVAANLNDEDWIRAVVARRRALRAPRRVLVNGGGLGVGAAAGEQQTKHVDLQLDVDLRAIVLFYRECLDMLRAAGTE